MSLNQEKLRIPKIRIKLKRSLFMIKKRLDDNALTKKTLRIAGERLGKWVSQGKYRLKYESKDAILRDLDLTADELSLYCKAKFGTTFLAWRKELRMEDAKRMLLDIPHLPAYKIGMALGIEDKSDFRHQFKSSTGMTPSQWRERFSKKKLDN